jgi:hypothetical protein
MAERRTRQYDSPRRRKRESTKAIIDQDEVPRTRAPYKPTELSSSYSSSSSYIDISRTFPPNRPRGLGAIRAFFTTPSEHRRRPRRRTSRPYLRPGSSSSSSINTDLAYGSGYIRRRRGDKSRRKEKERESGGRRDPRADVDPDAAILEVGAGLAALARKQNRHDLAEARRQGIAPPKRGNSGGLKGLDSSRGLGSSKVSHGPDEDGWESDPDADSETSSVDSRLAYGHGNGPGWGFSRSKPKRKDSVVDPALFGPANSLHGIIQEPVGFDDVDHDNLSDYPPPTVATLQREQNYPRQNIVSGSASATGPLNYVHPISTADPTRFDVVRSSVVSAQEPYDSRPAPVPIQQASVPIQQPQPKPVVAQSVFDPPYSTKSEPKVPSSSSRTKSSVAGAALAGVAGAAIGAALSSDRRDERKDRDRRRDEVSDAYDGDRRAERRKDEPRERPDKREGADDRREKRRERDRDEPEETREERRERRRREKRDDPDYERREKKRDKRRDDDIPDERADKRREDKYSERTDDRDDERQSRKDAPIVPPVDPFQYQVADDAFKTPDGTRNSEPFTSIQRARSPAVVTVERVPHWHRDASAKEKKVDPVDDAQREKDWEARDRQQTEQEAESLYEEIEHSTIPVEASAVSAAIAAEEHRHTREKVRKRRYDRSGDSSPTGERDPIQEEADRIYREAVLARKIAESKHNDSVPRVVTPPEMAHKKEILYPVPNADFELDHVMDPVEFMTSPIKGRGEGFDRIKSISGVALEDLKRPLLTLVRPTPTPSPAPEEQKSRSKRKDSSREAEPSEPKSSRSGRKESSRDGEPSEPKDRNSERKESSRDAEPSESQKKPTEDIAITEAKGDAVQTPSSANGTKGVTWGENDTKHYEVESPYETKDDPIASSVQASDAQEKPKMSKEKKASAWGALRGAFMSGAAAEVVAKAAEASKDEKEPKPERTEKDAKPESTEKDARPERKEYSRAELFEYRGVVVEPERSDNEVRERGPPAVGPKPSKMPGSNMPGTFDDDLDFTATLAAGLEDSGFDPNIVIKDPTYRRRSSPPGSEDPPLAGYKQPYAETVSDLIQYGAHSTERSRDIKAEDDDDYAKDRTEREQKKLDKAAKRQSSETRDLDLSEKTPVTSQLVEEPESFLESSKSSKKEKKRDKSRKVKDSYDEGDDRSNKRVSVPVDAFDDLRAEAAQGEAPEDWDTPKKSKRKSKRDSGQYDSPSRSMSASDITSSVEQSKKKSKDKSSKRSSQYDSEPNPEDVPLPSASEVSRDDEYDSRKSKRSSKRSSSISDVGDRDNRSVKSDSSRCVDEDDSRSTSKKEKKNSGFFGGIFGSSTSKSEPERSKDVEESESRKKSKKSKRSSTGDGSEIYGSDVKSDVKSSPNENGYEKYEGDEGDPKRSMNGDSKHGKAYEKEESFLDNAGTLGAGVGLAAAIALAAQHQQSKAATAEIEERVPGRSTPESVLPTQPPAVEDSREVFKEDVVDPEIVQRQFRPSIDPQYGDLLLLPPSDPGSPNIEPENALPSLPESRPNTPPKHEHQPPRDRSVGSSRRSELPALVKTPSHSAIPIKYIMGNRSTPSSPGMVRAPPTASPSAMSPDTLGFHRARPRPTSWDSTKEIQPLYLLDPSRRAPASQSTDSEVQSPAAEEPAGPMQGESSTAAPEITEEIPSSGVRDLAEEPQLERSETLVPGDQNQDTVSAAEFPDPTALPPLPKSRTPTPMGRGAHESDDLSSFPALPKSGTSAPADSSNLTSLPALPTSGTLTPVDSSDLSRLPQLPDSRSSTPAEDRSLQGFDLAAAGLLTGAALGLSAAALASASTHDKPVEAGDSAPKSTSTDELPAEFQVEPITKDRSSYLFQATPPAKRTKDVDMESPLEMPQTNLASLSRTVEEVPMAEDVSGSNDESSIRARSVERDAALEALTRSVPEGKEPSEIIPTVQSAAANESEADVADEFSFAKPKKNKKKDKKKQADQFSLEDDPSSNTVTPPSMADSSKDTEGPPEFSLKKSKKDRRKDKKRGSSQWDAEDDPSESAVPAPAIEATILERSIVDEPLSDVILPSSVAPPTEDAETMEEFSRKKSKKDKKKDKKKALDLSEPVSDASSSTALLPSIASAVKEADVVDEPSEPLSGTILPSSGEPPEDFDTVEQYSLKKSKDKKKDKKNGLGSVDPDVNASPSTTILPSVASTLKEAETVDEPSEPTSESLLPSSIEPADDVDTTEEFSLKKSKKDKKKALDWTESGDEVSPITVLPSSVASATQEADPSDEYSSTTSKKDKKKDKKNRESFSQSSTLVEPRLDEPTGTFGAKDVDFSRAEQTPLPVSRALSEAEVASEVGDVDTGTRDIVPDQVDRPQPAEPLAEPAPVKESKNGKKKGRKSLQAWEFEEASASDAVGNEPVTEVPLEREVEAFELTSKDITAIQDEPQIQPQADIIPIRESELAAEEPLTHELLQDEPVRDEPVKDQQVQKGIVEAEPGRESNMPDEPIKEESGNREISIEDPTTKDAIAAKEDGQDKAVEPFLEASNAKGSKKGKKKKGKSSLAWQDDEMPESRPTVDPISEPTTEAPSERDDLSGFSTPTSKSKGKKKQKRKSIAWDIEEPETEPSLEATRSIAASEMNTQTAPEETDRSKEIIELPRLEPGEPIAIRQVHSIKDEIDHVQETKPREEVPPYEPEVATKEVEKPLPQFGPSALSTTPTESEPFGTARSDFSGVEYFPSAASLHSPPVPKDLGESVETGYFPSAVRLLPAAAPVLAMATSATAPETVWMERSYPAEASLSTTTAQEVAADALDTLGTTVRHEHPPVDEPSSLSLEVSSADAQLPSSVSMSPHPKPVVTEDLPKQSHIDYFPSAAFLHSPSSLVRSEGGSGKGYFPSATSLLPLVGVAAVLTGEQYREREPLAKDIQDNKEPSLSRDLEYDEQPLPAADRKPAETTDPVGEKDVLDSKFEVSDEQGGDSKPSTPYSEEQLEAARQLNAEFGSGKKKSKKNKKGRGDLSRTSTQDDDLPTELAQEPDETPQQTEPDREIQVANEPQTADGLAAGYKEDQVALAKQLKAEFDSGAKKPKKGKKSRSTSRTPRDYESGSPFFEEPQAANIEPAEEASREIVPEDEDTPRKQGPDGLAAGFTPEQLEAARQMREDFASGSKKSKKDKKRKWLIRSATDENNSGAAAEDGSEETNLATTEVDSATDSPYPLSTVPTPDVFESSFTTKKGKKGKKRQSLLRSFTQDSEDSAGPGREITAEPEPLQLETFEKDTKAADITSDPILNPEEQSSSAVVEEPEALLFTTKKEKKGNKKRQSLLRTATGEEEPSSDPNSSFIDPEASRREIAEASTSQPTDVVADNDLVTLGEELNFSLKKSKKNKKGKKGKDSNQVLAGTEDVTQSAEQGIVTEREAAPKSGRDQESLADRIWAGIMPSESIQPETENPSAESEDPLGLDTTKKSKKNKKKAQAKSTSASEPEPLSADRDVRDPVVPMERERKEAPFSWADEIAKAEVEKTQPKLFDTWSFGNLPLDETAQETSAHKPQSISKDVKIAHDIKQEEVDRSHVSLPPDDDHSNEPPAQEQEKSTTDFEPVDDLETPPPMMPKALAWEDEPTQQETEVKTVGLRDLSASKTEGLSDSDAKGKTKHGVANPVSAGIIAAGAALLAGASMAHGKEPTEAEPLSIGGSRSAARNSEANTARPVDSEKKREKRPARLADRRSLPKDDIFDDPMLWEGAEAQKFGDHMIEDEAGDDAGFWSAPVEEEEKTKDEFAVDDVEDGPSMPHKRERSESLMDVLEPSTVLDHIKTPRKHQYEDVPAAITRDAIMEQEKAEKQPVQPDNLSRDISEEEPLQTDKSVPVSHWNDVPEDIWTPSSKKAKKNKKQSRLAAWDIPAKDEEADVGSSYTTTIDTSTSRDIDAAPIEDQRTSIISEATKAHVHDRHRDQESQLSSPSALPSVSEPETFQPSRRGHEESAKDKHRRQEIYLPPPPTIPQATEDESVLQRELDVAPLQLPSEGRAKDKHRRQESYLPPPPTLPVVIEEEYHKPESEHISRERGINDNNRDSALVTESPVPFQRRIAEDREYARDSGVHLRDWGDTPVSKEKPHVASADDALARLSWPAVDEKTETVDLKRSQRPKDERSPKAHAASPALVGAGAVAVTELAHLAARSPPQNKDKYGENAKFDRSITPNMGRLQTPDHAKYRPGSVSSNRSSGTPPLRRSDRKLSGDLRSLSQRSQANLAKEAKDAKEAEHSPATSVVNINPIANEGRPRVKDMADVYVSHREASNMPTQYANWVTGWLR